jgi:hypothetical protein
MANLGETFNAQDLPESTSEFAPLPAGWYSVTISGAELKQTKAGTGQFIAIKYDVTGPTHQGRIIFGNLNIRNPNEKAEEIGRQQLGEIMRASGLGQIKDTDQLIGANLSIKLAIKNDPQYGESNEVKGFKATSGASGSFPSSMPAQAAQQQAQPAQAAAPWAKRG